jgi:hypothetical protein
LAAIGEVIMPQGILVTRDRLKKHIVGRILKPYWVSNAHYGGFSDNKFYLPTLEEISTYVTSPATTVKPPESFTEAFDCDDFSFAFKGSLCLYTRDKINIPHSICFGIAWGRFTWLNEFHACNWVVTDDLVLRWIEPQTQKFFPLTACRKESLRLLIA